MLADPRRLSAEASRHEKGCRGCREFLARTQDEEALLARALHVAVPEGLHARILRRTAAAAVQWRWRWLALAATVILGVAVALATEWSGNDELALAGIEFVVFEEAQSITDAGPADWSALVRVAREMGYRFQSSSERCTISAFILLPLVRRITFWSRRRLAR